MFYCIYAVVRMNDCYVSSETDGILAHLLLISTVYFYFILSMNFFLN